jgi:glycosyltransferase involved in cell wall biosynthesis
LGDADGLAAALLRIVEDPALRIRLRQAGRRRIESEFSFSNRLRRVEELYAALVATLPQPGRFKGYGRTVKAVDGEA